MNRLPDGPSLPPAIQLLRWAFSPNEFLRECTERFGDVFTIRLPNSQSVFFSHPSAIKEIFTGDPENLHLRPVTAFLRPVLGENSLLLLDGRKHLRERKLMSPPFHGDRMQLYGELIQQLTREVLRATPKNQVIAAYPKMQEITLAVMLRAVFGLEDGARLRELQEVLQSFLEQASRPFFVMLSMLYPKPQLRTFFEEAAKTRRIAGLDIEVGKFLPGGALVRAAALTDRLIFEEIARRRKENLEGRRDILSLLLQATDETGKPMTDEELHNEMITLLIAGYETTANSLAWVFYHVLRDPAVHARLRESLAAAVNGSIPLPSNGRGTELTDEQDAASRGIKPCSDARLSSLPLYRINQLEYLDAVIKESMRLTPAIPIIARRLVNETTIGGWTLPAKTVVTPAICLAHLRADIWPEPARFMPERFVGRRVSPYEFFPFGGGVRKCIGMAFALYEMKIVLAEIFTSHMVERAPDIEVKQERRGVNFAPSHGMPLIFS